MVGMGMASSGLGDPVDDTLCRRGGFIAAAAGVALIATVFAAVYHAEVIAHRTGEPFGTLVLAIAVTVIEVALIVSVMVSAPAEKAGLARDTVFAAVMIVMNGIVGLCLLWGGVRHHEQGFQLQGASAALAVLAALTTLTLVVPNVATTSPVRCSARRSLSSPESSHWCSTARSFSSRPCGTATTSFRSKATTRKRTRRRPRTGRLPSAPDCWSPPWSPSWGLRNLSRRRVETGIAWLDMPKAVVGIVIAALVLLPEGLAALRAAQANRLQTSLNLALGSILAAIGLTIPAVALVSIVLGQPLELGLDDKDQVLLALTLIVGVITLGTGRTTVLQGIVHLVIFAVFLFFAAVP